MNFSQLPVWFYLQHLPQLLQSFCLLVVAAVISIRIERVRVVLQAAHRDWRSAVIASVYFGVLAIISNHSGILINEAVQGGQVLDWAQGNFFKLEDRHALLGFRYTLVITAGFTAGPWVGLGAGIMAGLERYLCGGSTPVFSGVSTVVLGLGAGLVQYYRPHWLASAGGIFAVASIGILGQRLALSLATTLYFGEQGVAMGFVLPIKLLSILGCVVFFWVLRDLDRERIEKAAQTAILEKLLAEQECEQLKSAVQQAQLHATQAQLGVLMAQIEPHFLNNCFNNLKALIRTEPDLARDYVIQLAQFFNATRQFSSALTISVRQEVAQLQRYIHLQRLAKGRDLSAKLTTDIIVDDELLDVQIIPFSLICLVENVFQHGLDARKPHHQLLISGTVQADGFIFKVVDNGVGISPERLAVLGKQAVTSAGEGGGVALFQLVQSYGLWAKSAAHLSIDSQQDNGTTVTLTLPHGG